MEKRTRYFQSTLGVFQGGGCRAAAFAGAYEVAQQAGVSFVEVAGTSAGSIAAALIAAGATALQLQEMLRTLDFTKFQVPKRRTELRSGARLLDWGLSRVRVGGVDLGSIAYHGGMYSSEYIETWMEKQLQLLLKREAGGVVRFKDLIIPLSVVATDLSSRSAKVWSSRNTSDDSVAKAVRASCSIPVYFQPVGGKYVDGGVLSNLPSFVYSGNGSSDVPLASRVLAFALQADAKTETGHMLFKLADTVVDGNQHIQATLQGDVPTRPRPEVAPAAASGTAANACRKPPAALQPAGRLGRRQCPALRCDGARDARHARRSGRCTRLRKRPCCALLGSRLAALPAWPDAFRTSQLRLGTQYRRTAGSGRRLSPPNSFASAPRS